MGRHPVIGLTPISRCTAHSSFCFCCCLSWSRRLYFSYFLLISCMRGCAFCILRDIFICEMRVGSSARLMMTVSSTMAHPQLDIPWSCVQLRHSNIHLPNSP